jgi:uncharacterized protein
MPGAPRLPPPLRRIAADARASAETGNLREVGAEWQEYLARVVRDVPEVRSEDGGEALYLGELSPGCRACKDGTWDCIFVTSRCNLACGFCFSPWSAEPTCEWRPSVFGSTPEEIVARHRGLRIEGLAFSGGEPFLETERLLDWIGQFKKLSPARYCWVYTNGLLVTEAVLARLVSKGLDEIRFNMAATGYDDQSVLENVRVAARLIPRVTVEIPAIPAHAVELFRALDAWANAGVRWLNLHELMYEPHSNSAALPGQRRMVLTADGHRSALDPRSRELALAVLRKVSGDRIPLSVNVCSLQSKLRQIRGRRRNLAAVLKQPHERLIEDELVTCCLFGEDDDQPLAFVDPARLAEARRAHPGCRAARLSRMAPLVPGEPARWTAVVALDDPVADP